MFRPSMCRESSGAALRRLLSPINTFGLIALLIAGTGTAVAATGGSLLLGKDNSAGQSTILRNTGSGTALALRTTQTTVPPLTVGTNKTRVPYLNSDLLDGVDSTALQRRVSGTCPGAAISAIGSGGAVACTALPAALVRTVWVSPTASALDSGSRLRDAVAAITTATETSPWIVRIEPGLYDLGTTGLLMKPFVAVAGAGRGLTTVTSSIACCANGSAATIRLAPNAPLTDLTVINTAAAAELFNEGTAVRAQSAGTHLLEDVELRAVGSATTTIGLEIVGAATVIARRVLVTASGSNDNAYALYNFAGTLEFYDGRAEATSYSLYSNATTRIAGSQLVGPRFKPNGTLYCAATYNGTWDVLTKLCGDPA